MTDFETLPFWIEIIVAILLLASAMLTLGASWGLVRMRTFVQRMHPPALQPKTPPPTAPEQH